MHCSLNFFAASAARLSWQVKLLNGCGNKFSSFKIYLLSFVCLLNNYMLKDRKTTASLANLTTPLIAASSISNPFVEYKFSSKCSDVEYPFIFCGYKVNIYKLALAIWLHQSNYFNLSESPSYFTVQVITYLRGFRWYLMWNALDNNYFSLNFSRESIYASKGSCSWIFPVKVYIHL